MDRPPYVPRISFGRLRAATNGFAEANKIGSGATGDVYRGDLDGAPVAVKALKLKVRSPEARAATELAFRRELDVLSAYRHARLVKILGFGVDDRADTETPFALYFELLTEGSLADWLRSPNGMAPKKTRAGGAGLTALERVDIALGAASALSFLHGQRDESAGGGDVLDYSADGGAARLAPPPPCAVVLHRDVKAANIGITTTAGALVSKLLDCGLAKAIKGDDSAAGTSSTSGFVGTAGYTARELSRGATVKTEIYAFGVVLIELLTGTRAGTDDGVDSWTANGVLDASEDEGGSSMGLVARADAAWPHESAVALAALSLQCIQDRAARRPSDAKTVILRLREIRALVDSAGPPLVECCVCKEYLPETQVLRCDGPEAHALCSGCLQGHVVSHCENASRFRATSGNIPCPAVCDGCTASWSVRALGEKLDKGTHVALSCALIHITFDAPRLKAELEAARAAAEAAAHEAGLALAERVRRLRDVIVDRDLTLHCPRCSTAFVDFVDCLALHCKDACGAAFCGLCLADCGDNAHSHFYSVHRGVNIYDQGRRAFNGAHFERRRAAVIAAVRACAPDGVDVQRALVAELAKADFSPLGISADDILAGADVGVLPIAAVVAHPPIAVVHPAISLIARDRALAEISAAGNETASIVRVMRECLGNAKVCAFAARTLTRLTLTPEQELFALDLRAHDVLVSALLAHAGDEDVALYGIWVLSNIASITAGQQAAVDARVPAAVVAAMRAHAGDANIVHRGCFFLANVAALPAGQQAAVDARASEAVVMAMRTHVANADVIHRGSWALASIATITAGQQAAVDARAPAAVVAAMRAHAGDANIAHRGCFFLANVAALPAGQQAAVDARASEAVVMAMRTHVANADVVHRGSWALASIATITAGQQAAVDARAPAAVVAAMRAHAGDANIAHRGCFFLANVAALPAGQQAAVDARASEAVVATMRGHAAVFDIAFRGSWALASIATITAGQQAAIDAGATATIVAAVRAHAGASEVAHRGCRALTNIAILPAGQQAAVDAAALDIVIAAMGVHSNIADVAEHGCRALLNFAWSLPAGKNAVAQAGGRRAITNAINRHESAKGKGLEALARLPA